MNNNEVSFSSDVVASALSGILAVIPLHPFDTIKARSMSCQVSSFTLSQMIHRLWQEEGLKGFYRGFGIAVCGSAPGVCLYLSTYEICRRTLLEYSHTDCNLQSSRFVYQIHYANAFAISLASGCFAEAISCVLWVPVDVLKERLQCQTRDTKYGYRGSWNALCTCIKAEGIVGLYRGYWSTLLCYAPTSALYFAFYETLQTLFTNDDACKSFASNMRSALVANALASGITCPLDVIKIRLQIQRTHLLDGRGQVVLSHQFKFKYSGIFNALLSVMHEEGFKRLYRGWYARVLFSAPNAALTMSIFQKLRTTFHNQA